MEYSSKEPPFLDIFIKNENSRIITDINDKPIETPKYLHFNNNHTQKMHKIHSLNSST